VRARSEVRTVERNSIDNNVVGSTRLYTENEKKIESYSFIIDF